MARRQIDQIRSMLDLAEDSEAGEVRCVARGDKGQALAIAVYIEDPEKAAILDRLLTQWEREAQG